MKHIIITGHRGNLGNLTYDYLIKGGNNVQILDMRSEQWQNNLKKLNQRIKQQFGTNIGLTLIHYASVSSKKIKENEESAYMFNTYRTLQLANIASEIVLDNLIFTSSVHATNLINGDNSLNLYGVMKRIAEQNIQLIAESKKLNYSIYCQ